MIFPSQKRILLLSGEKTSQSHIYRMERLGDILYKNFKVSYILKDKFNHEMSSHEIKQILNVDIIWAFRVSWAPLLVKAVKQFKKKGGLLIFDIDDLVFIPELMIPTINDCMRFFDEATLAQTNNLTKNLKKFLQLADMAVAPTKTLASYMERYASVSAVLPNGFDTKLYTVSQASISTWKNLRKDTAIRIGYASGVILFPTHQADFAHVAQSLAIILKKYKDVILVLFRKAIYMQEFPLLQEYANQIEWRDIVPLENLPQELVRFDINIAPLNVANHFCHCKSELKYFEAALVNVPTIASPTQPFKDAIVHGETGFLAETTEQWVKAFTLLIEHPEERERIGHNAHQAVLEPYGPERREQLAKSIIKQAWDIAQARRWQNRNHIARGNDHA